jgi:hypothetical protein
MPEALRTPPWKCVRYLAALLLLPASHAGHADDSATRQQEIQRLVRGEIVFYARQKDYAEAITRMLLAYEQGTLPPLSRETQVLLARLKLAYGLDVEAGFALQDLQAEGITGPVSNRAWYELAREFFRKGYVGAAQEALDQIRGDVPEDLRGQHQLLVAQVLMAQDRNEEAAQRLDPWRGTTDLAGYAYYNRGIALARSHHYTQAIAPLQQAAALKGTGEELYALKDKANLALGYAFAQLGDLTQAGQHLRAVRLRGPFSNRALLALGWVARNQGQDAEALVPWTELRSRSTADPAVLESLLIVPAVQRELAALPTAIRDYQSAVSALTDELRQLAEARRSVEQGAVVDVLLQRRPRTGNADASPVSAPSVPQTQYYGQLLASRIFQQTASGYHDLNLLLQSLDRQLDTLDRLAQHRSTPTDSGTRDRADTHRPGALGAAATGGSANAGESGNPGGSAPVTPQWAEEWEYGEGKQWTERAPAIPDLPEINLPGDKRLKSPQSDFTGLPVSDFDRLPAAPDVFGVRDPEVIAYPDTGIRALPDTGRVKLPFQDDDYAYPDAKANEVTHTLPPTRRRILRRLDTAETAADQAAGPAAAGGALEELASELARAAQRVALLGQSSASQPANLDLGKRLAALRERILRVREGVLAAQQQHERFARALALADLKQRENRLQSLLEQARLELAKTYDQASGH